MESFDESASAWTASGAAGLSGRETGPPLAVPESLVSRVAAISWRLRERSTKLGRPVDVDGLALLGERAAHTSFGRQGAISCGGATRLMQTADGWLALSLARDDDRELLPAWLERDVPDGEDGWTAIGEASRRRSGAKMIERAVMLGLPAARLGEACAPMPPVRRTRLQGGTARSHKPISDAVVVDLSALWAGPLAANLLGLAGTRVIKVESDSRPDGARFGPPAFFDLLHGGHESVALDFGAEIDRRALRRLLVAADIVITASRPRALEQLGVGPERTPGPSVWLTITGHGWSGDDGNRVAFGDDAAVAGALVTRDDDGVCFCADAVADPATGLVAASAALDAWDVGLPVHLDIALSRVAASLTGGPLLVPGPRPVPPRSRTVAEAAAALGQHTDAILAEFAPR